jgi:hypothetical protein
MGRLAVVGNWVKEKLAALRSNSKSKVVTAPGDKPKAQQPPRRHQWSPWWVRNMVHPTAGAEARGRTLNPYAVAQAQASRSQRIAYLNNKVTHGNATAKETRELHRITG